MMQQSLGLVSLVVREYDGPSISSLALGFVLVEDTTFQNKTSGTGGCRPASSTGPLALAAVGEEQSSRVAIRREVGSFCFSTPMTSGETIKPTKPEHHFVQEPNASLRHGCCVSGSLREFVGPSATYKRSRAMMRRMIAPAFLLTLVICNGAQRLRPSMRTQPLSHVPN